MQTDGPSDGADVNPPRDDGPYFGGRISVAKDGSINIFVYEGTIPSDYVTVRTANEDDQVVNLGAYQIYPGQSKRGRMGKFYPFDYVSPGQLLYVYYGGTERLLDGRNPLRIGAEAGITNEDNTSLQKYSDDNETIRRGRNEMDRDQIKDMIALSEAQTDIKFEKLVGEMREASTRQEAKFDALARRIEQFQNDVRDGRAEARSNRNIILATVLPTVLATGLAVGAFLLASQANLLSAFQAGVALRSAPVEKVPPGSP